MMRWSSSNRRLLTFGVLLLAWTIGTIDWIVLPYFPIYIRRLLSQHNIDLVLGEARPRPFISFTSVGIQDVELNIRDTAQDMPYVFTVHAERLEYRLGRSDPQYSSDEQKDSRIIAFAHILCSNITIVVHEPHPQPRLELLDLQITFYAPPYRETVRRIKDILLSSLKPHRAEEQVDGPSSSGVRIGIEVGMMQVTTHTVTSIPVSVTHPAIAWLINHYPILFGRSLPEEGSPSSESDDHLTIYPPHLSLLTPSIILPAAYQALSQFRTQHRDEERDDKRHRYHIPISFPLSPLEVNFQTKGRKGIENARVHLSSSAENRDTTTQWASFLCSEIDVMHIRDIQIADRDAEGGGCCALYVRQISNKEVNTTLIPDTTMTILDIALFRHICEREA